MSVNHDPISRAEPAGTAADRRTGVGGLLRASRLRCGEELDVIAEVLRIRRRHLQAIEDGEFDQLPGTTYAVGFIRAYADYLGLDAEEVVRRFKEEQTIQPGRPPKSDLVFPSPMSETGIPRGAVVFLGVLIGVIAYGGWYSSTVDNDFFKKWIEPVPARLAALLPNRGGDEAPDRTQAIAADKPAEPDETQVTTSPERGQDAMPADKPADATQEVSAAAPSAEAVSEAAQPTAEPAPETVSGPPSEPAASEPAAATEAPQSVETAATPAEPAADISQPVETAEATAPAVAETASVQPPESIAQPVETAQLPEPEVQTPAEPVAQETTGDASEATAQQPSPETSVQPAEATAAASESQPTSEAEQPAATEVASTPQEAVDARIVLTAISDSWVEVREMGTDTWVWGKLLRAGETYPVPDRPDLKLKTGNAGGLTITVDGASVPPVGASGEVVRNVLLDPDRLKSGTAVFR